VHLGTEKFEVSGNGGKGDPAARVAGEPSLETATAARGLDVTGARRRTTRSAPEART
jgi:hypothetical protein